MGTSTLLGHLAQFGAFSAQAELLCTQGLAHLLRTYESARRALAADVTARTGVTLDETLHWQAEVRQDDLTRPDLEAKTNGGTPRVKIEAKLLAGLGQTQLQAYATDLARAGLESVLLVLVPAHRTKEAATTASQALSLSGSGPWPAVPGETPAVAVVSWDDLFEALGQEGSERFRLELEEFQAMYRVLSGDFAAPLASPEDLRQWRERESDFHDIVNQATRRLNTYHATYPTGVDSVEPAPDGLEPKGYWRRYVCPPHGDTNSCFSIGVRDSFAEWRTPIWMRFHQETYGFALIRQRIEASELRRLESRGDLWLPLDVPLGSTREQMIEAVVEQAEAVLQIAIPPA